MNISQPVHRAVQRVKFSFYKEQEVLALSVLQITNPQIFDTLDHPCSQGLYDPRLGPHDKKTICATCFLDESSCPGHFGHVLLSVPCYNTVSFGLMYRLLKGTCLWCHKFRVSEIQTLIFSAKLKLLNQGLVLEASGLDEHINAKIKGEEGEEEVATDLKVDLVLKINSYVQNSISNRKNEKIRSTLIIDARRKLEKEFLGSINKPKCQNCQAISAKFRQEKQQKIFKRPISKKSQNMNNARNIDGDKGDSDQYVSPITVKEHLVKLWKNEECILSLLYGNDPSMFFLTVLAVTPTKFRPVSKMGDMMFEHPQNINLVEILKANHLIQDIQEMEKAFFLQDNNLTDDELKAKKEDFLRKTVDAWVQLQTYVNYLLDSSNAPSGKNGKTPPPGIRQLLEKKEGLFRKHMMGKRVNFACRSVISPDPYIETNEIGIPPVFAKKLTYPEPVTYHNIDQMRKCVINGPEQWPGATHVQNEDGTLIALSAFDESGRKAIASQLLTPSHQIQFKNTNKKVLRHLRNGDYLLLNRQPTLHKPSIMAHTARVLPGERTIRMHYANCNTYNADFDGDEMNAHFPQNEIARAESMLIARTDQQYLVPTDGSVLRGLIQDHVDAGVDMTSRDSFFTREEYVQLVYSGLRETSSASQIGNGNIEKEIIIGDMGRIRVEPPVLFKPKQLWTGKQIISTILMNLCPSNPSEGLNLISKSKIPAKYWGDSGKEEDRVVFMDGYLVAGILDKSQFGASSNGLVHAVYEIYGAVYAGRLLSILGRLFTAYLQKTGFTCRMDDLLLTKQGDSFRKDLIETNSTLGTIVAEQFAGNGSITLGLEKVLRNSELMASLDSKMKQKTNLVTSEIISGCIPDKLYKPFPKNNMQVMTVSGAKGSSVNVSQISCLLGQQELEGKRVPTMVSGKTLPSFQAFNPSARAGGYITGRFLTGIKPQEYYFHCMAGREGLIDTAVKTSRSGYLQRCLIKGLEGITVKYDSTVRDSDGSVLQFRYGEDALDVCKQTTLLNFNFCAMNYKALVKRYVKNLVGVDEFSVKKYLKKGGSEVLSDFEPSKYIGAVSSKFAEKLSQYMDKNEHELLRVEKQKRGSWSQEQIKKSKFKMLMDLKYMHSLVEPGESVGLLAAQSIGEPSTQMTLNTFHFAGFGAKNVTLGIPRLREIIMTASSHIKTPLMTLPLRDHVTLKQKEDLCGEISQFTLDQIMTGVRVVETLVPKSILPRRKMLKVRLEFWDSKDYKKQFGISRDELKIFLERKLFVPLERAITRVLKGLQRKQDDISVGTSKIASKEVNEDDEIVVSQKENESESDPESDEEGDGGTEVTKTRSKKQQQSSYDDDDELAESSEEEEEQEEKEQVEEQVQDTKYISGFSFDSKGKYCELTINFQADTQKILMVNLVEEVCKKLVIHQVKGIVRCFPQQNDTENDKQVKIGTEGCNLRGIWNYQSMIDIDKIYTNDISAILNTYGVEAARESITSEIASVFGVYGINVDKRHLSLIADYMTFEGGYKPFNRIGMDSHTSPFAQMSYERTTHFLTQATVNGGEDLLDNPSARIVMGKVVGAGTGAFDILQPLV